MTKNLQSDVLSLFNCLVVNSHQEMSGPPTRSAFLAQGIVVNFSPEGSQLAALEEVYKPLPVTTLFTREEREHCSTSALLLKQVLHYIEVYGLDTPGLFNLEVSGGTIVSMRYVVGISVGALEVLVQNLLYANAPVKDAKLVQRIVDGYRLHFDINRVANNELRVLLWNDSLDAFTSGDDAVRYLCAQADGPLLIKSKEVIAAVKKIVWTPHFFELHERVLAEVFNRHKRIILAAKNRNTATIINRISRLSKTAHVPIKSSIAKRFISLAFSTPAKAAGFNATAALAVVSVRDKLKFLNVLAVKRVQANTAAYRVRNGKIFIRGDRPVYTQQLISEVEYSVLMSLAADLQHLKNRNILLDQHVDYGLPTTRKQTVGQLPFGTLVSGDGDELSSGMYWENEWGARDLDLSTIDLDGNRVGWGGRSAYAGHHNITFSGDLTDARNGAMEFMTSSRMDYGLFVNVYSGNTPSNMELVIGTRSQKNSHWMDDVLIREKHTLTSRDSIIGFVRGRQFMVYAGRLSNSKVSGDNPIVNESKVKPWTISKLFLELNIPFDVDRDGQIEYDHDLSYSSFSFDKLEAVFATG